MKTILEPSREIPVFDEADVLVIGSGPGGHSAAIAAARAGAKKIVLVERYNHLGGMVSGGFVVLIPHLSFNDQVMVKGLQQEWIDRMEKLDKGAFGPRPEQAGSTDPEVMHKYDGHWGFAVNNNVNYGSYLDPDMLKVVLDEMVEEEKAITTYLHCWGVGAVMDGDEIKGVIIESKEGRKAIMAKIVIDGTGDADILAFAGGTYDDDRDLNLRNANTAGVYRLGGLDFDKYAKWKAANPDEWYKKHSVKLMEMVGFRMSPHSFPRNDQCWINNWIPKYCLDVKDLTETDMSVRRTMFQAIEYMKENLPGFENAHLIDIAPQTGTRGSRRIHGIQTLSDADIKEPNHYDDVVSVVPPFNFGVSQSPTEVPYGVIVPQKIDNLLIAGRSFSSTRFANDWSNLVPHCSTLGQAAGVAAAIALQEGVKVRDVNVKKLQDILREQGQYLPR
ncbi:FAD-dependent oxidoreductase [Oscillospiraceae bacterium MB08-C2-2]|nr:FAD-dependent oxidoreductase [Oscillospiraceae bacterium MB08-C2-2]